MFFILDGSLLDAGDLLSPADDNPIQQWDYYKYLDYTDRVVDIEWSREIEFPYSTSAAIADFTVNNYDNYFTPDKGSPIDQYILPKRPLRLYSGFANETILQQFVGITEKMPVIDQKSKTAAFHAMDFLAEMFSMPLKRLVAMSNVRTDEVLAALFDQFGLSPSSYQLARGRNKIPFLFFEKDKNAGNAFRELMQAEGGQLWIDEQGIIRFSPRLERDEDPVLQFNETNTESISTSGDTNIINTVRITSVIRALQAFQKVYTSNDPETGASAFTEPQTIPANGSLFIEISLDDPLLTVDTPSNGVSMTDSWFTAKDVNGAAVTTNVAVTLTNLHVNNYVMLFENNNAFPVTIDALEVWGEPAKEVDTLRYTARDTDSVDKYGEQVLEIDNNMFGSEGNAEAFAMTVLNAYAEFNGVIEIKGKGDPSLQLGDIISVDTRDITGDYKIIKIAHRMANNKAECTIKAEKYIRRHWFILDESLLDGTDILAP